MACLVFLILLCSSSLYAQSNSSNSLVKQLIKEVDEMYRSESSYSELEMEIITPHWQRTLAMYGWSEGQEKTFIRITSPKKEKGVTTLRIENEMWNYLPKTDKVMKIPPSMMMSSWMGSDFTNDDLVKEFSLFDDYTYDLIHPEGEPDSLHYINCIPNEGVPVVWNNIVIGARKNDHIPVWQKYYDEKGKLMRLMRYSDVTDFGGRLIPAVMEMIPQNKEGHKTSIKYLKLEFDINPDKGVFSLRNLQSKN